MHSQVNPLNERRLLSTREAAELLGVTVRCLEGWRACSSNGPRFIRLSTGAHCRAVRYRLADLEAWIAEREATSTSDPGLGAGDGAL